MHHVNLYVHDLRSSGVVRNAIDFARRLAQDHPTTLVCGYAEGFFAEDAARGPFRLVALAERPGPAARLTAAIRLRAWLSRQPGGVILSVGNMGHWTPYLAGVGLAHVARIYCISNEVARDDGVRSAIRLLWMRLLLADAARTVVVGRALRRLPLFDRAIRRGRAVELPNGVDVELARRLAIAPSPHPWLAEDVPVVVGIGRLRPQKNFDLLIAGVARARATRRLRLAIIGGGSPAEQARLAALADAAGLGEDFLLAGETDNVFAWLARAAVFALPSRWETSSLALLEALAAGAPCVASRLAGDAALVLDEGRYGRLFDGECPDALAEALLAQASPDAVRPGDRAQAYAAPEVNDAYARLVAEVLAGQSARADTSFRRAPAITPG
jgi:glycosyltransferase involved in cell wall biosynthesis